MSAYDLQEIAGGRRIPLSRKFSEAHGVTGGPPIARGIRRKRCIISADRPRIRWPGPTTGITGSSKKSWRPPESAFACVPADGAGLTGGPPIKQRNRLKKACLETRARNHATLIKGQSRRLYGDLKKLWNLLDSTSLKVCGGSIVN